MQVKICPKCGTENKLANLSCANCYGSLDGVEPSLSKPPDTTAKAPDKAPVKPVQAPQPNAYVQQPGPGPSSPAGYSAYGRQPTPRRKSAAGPIISFLVIVALLGAVGLWVWQYMNRETPEQVAQKILAAVVVGDLDTIKSRVTDATYNEIIKEYGTEDAFIQTVKKSFDQPQDELACAGEGTPEGTDAVFVGVTTKDGKSLAPDYPDLSIGLVMVREGGRWKLDTARTEAHAVDAMDRTQKKLGRYTDWGQRYYARKARHGGVNAYTLLPFPVHPH